MIVFPTKQAQLKRPIACPVPLRALFTQLDCKISERLSKVGHTGAALPYTQRLPAPAVQDYECNINQLRQTSFCVLFFDLEMCENAVWSVKKKKKGSASSVRISRGIWVQGER